MGLLKKYLLNITFIMVVVLFLGNTTTERRPDFCNIFGGIYVEEYPNKADFKVYDDESEAFADILIFEEDNKLFADRKGIWFFTKDRNFADYTIYFTDDRNSADFSVYFTDTESFAGCNQ